MSVRRGAVVALVAALALGGCTAGTSTGNGYTEDGQSSGYISSDGSTQTWAPDERGEPVEVSGTDFTGAPVDVADWRGDVVVLNTWYAACPPCRAEAPDLVALATEYADDGVHLLGINGTDDAGAAQAFERTFDVPYPSLADTDNGAVAALQGYVSINAVPTTVVLDREGRVAARVLGLADGSTLRAMVDDLLAEPVAAA
ncbi:TlpA disulfide reductase family protein [Cellulomonas sp. ATA003]|uniref:TlpA family protein disulfide reductase n=1 Tax=Cellulomonas sp. ATA003 TaxID=3073064 RepID=UPI002873A318|nr:TlpA disulfide reductase family protein [Cellulomonas sp. ATA003]WNB85931.1 TlpA disulfide reductase family protein [Cellulomonas sp. ATA003]